MQINFSFEVGFLRASTTIPDFNATANSAKEDISKAVIRKTFDFLGCFLTALAKSSPDTQPGIL
jgi:hypothetical protein